LLSCDRDSSRCPKWGQAFEEASGGEFKSLEEERKRIPELRARKKHTEKQEICPKKVGGKGEENEYNSPIPVQKRENNSCPMISRNACRRVKRERKK